MEASLREEARTNFDANDTVLERVVRIDIPRFRSTSPEHGFTHGFQNLPSKFERTLDALEWMQDIPQRILPRLQWITQLSQDTYWDLFIDTVRLWPSVLGHEVRSKQLIPKGEKG